MKFVYRPAYLKAFDAADTALQKQIIQTDKEIKNYLETGQARYGLRIKKIGRLSFEGRVSDKIRIVWVKEKGLISFAMVGDHRQVQNYLRNFQI
ncbi:MAG: hypothetical protein HY592_01795 [Candidatus Omnitrophica bacterium]|nr:hypothetical protein [Candidatus Omnitrophota bacterium]